MTNFLDLFSGIGGFSLGFKRAGYKFAYHGFSDTQRYKCLGNAVSVPVVEVIANKLKGYL